MTCPARHDPQRPGRPRYPLGACMRLRARRTVVKARTLRLGGSTRARARCQAVRACVPGANSCGRAAGDGAAQPERGASRCTSSANGEPGRSVGDLPHGQGALFFGGAEGSRMLAPHTWQTRRARAAPCKRHCRSAEHSGLPAAARGPPALPHTPPACARAPRPPRPEALGRGAGGGDAAPAGGLLQGDGIYHCPTMMTTPPPRASALSRPGP